MYDINKFKYRGEPTWGQDLDHRRKKMKFSEACFMSPSITWTDY